MIIERQNDGLILREVSGEELELLHQVVEDVSLNKGGAMSEVVSAEMPDESEWDEWIVPELDNQFAQQIEQIKTALSTTEASQEFFTINIKGDQLMNWYGALNQARFALEQKYRFSQHEKASSAEPLSKEFIDGSVRYDCYSQLQLYLWQAIKAFAG